MFLFNFLNQIPILNLNLINGIAIYLFFILLYYYYFFLFTTEHIYQTKESFIFRLSKVNVLIPRICFVQRISLLEGDATMEILKQLTRFSGTFRDSKFLFHYRYNFRTMQS